MDRTNGNWQLDETKPGFSCETLISLLCELLLNILFYSLESYIFMFMTQSLQLTYNKIFNSLTTSDIHKLTM